MHQEEFIAVALGETKADLVIKNAKVVNVLTEEIYESEVAIACSRCWKRLYRRKRNRFKGFLFNTRIYRRTRSY